MAKVLTDESNYEDIADAIREKNGSSDTYLPSEMAEAVRDIPTGGAVQSVNGKTGAVVLDAEDVGAGTYSKPSGGIPKTDLASSVQTSLGKADTALQAAPVTSVNGQTGAVVLNAADVGAKAVQTAVSDPTAQNNSVAFIDSISQDTQGKITATKKYVRSASENETGLMLPSDKIDIKNLKSGLAYTFPIKSTLDYPIPKGTAVFFSNDKNISYIYISDIDIMNAEDDASPGAWRGPLIPAYAYTQHIQSVLDRNDIRVTNVENANATLQDDVLAVNEMALAAYPTDSAEGRMASFSDGAAGLPLKALTVDIVPVQAGSGTPSPTNVRAISGVTAAAVTRCGKNLLNPDDAEIGRAWNGASASNRARLVVPCMPDTTYTISASGVSTLSNIYATSTASVPASSAGAEITSRMPFTMTTRSDAQYIVVAFSKDSIAQEDIDALNLQIEIGSAATEYEPYTAQSIHVSFPEAAGIVYGGTLDVTRGVLTVDRIIITIDGSADSRLASFNTSDANVNRVQSNIYNDIGVANIVFDACDRFEPIAPTTTSSLYKVWNSPTAPRVFFGLPKTVTTLDEAKAWFAENPTHVVAKIASPQTYQLDPAEVLTLLGANTIYADCGDVTVTYRADPTLAAFVQDVQINGNSILNNGVANVPIASSSSPGVVKVGSGLQVGSGNELKTNPATSANIKAGTDANKPLAPSMQHAAAFYGLAKAAGDTSQSQSANAVGTYTDEAKAAVQRMLGLYNRGELIADVTTTEDATEIVVDTDLSGQAFMLTKLIAIFSAGPSTTGARDSFYGQFVGFDENNIQKTMSFPSMQYVTATSAMWAKITLRVEPGMPITCEAIIATSEGNTQNIQGMAKELVIEYITRFRIYQSGSNKSLIPAGTNLKVYGVRA